MCKDVLERRWRDGLCCSKRDEPVITVSTKEDVGVNESPSGTLGFIAISGPVCLHVSVGLFMLGSLSRFLLRNVCSILSVWINDPAPNREVIK